MSREEQIKNLKSKIKNNPPKSPNGGLGKNQK